MGKTLRWLTVLAFVLSLSCIVFPAPGQDFEDEGAEELGGEETTEEVGDTDAGGDEMLIEEEGLTAEEIAEDYETDKALEAQVAAKNAAIEAENALGNGDYELAVAKFKEALDLAPDDEAYAERLKEVQKKYVYDLLKEDRYAEAVAQADDFLARFKDPNDPQVQQVENFRETAAGLLEAPPAEEEEEAAEVAKRAMPTLKARTDKELVAEAMKAYHLKDYELAKDLLLDARDINKYNVEVDRWLDEVNRKIGLHERSIRETTRRNLMIAVDRAWNQRPPRPEYEIGPIKAPDKPEQSEARILILEKLDTIIPAVDFKDAELREVIEFLAREAKVNIVIDPVVFITLGTTPEMPTTTGPSIEPFPEVPSGTGEEFPMPGEEAPFPSEFAPQGGGFDPRGDLPPEFGTGFETAPGFPAPPGELGGEFGAAPALGTSTMPQSSTITIHLENVPLKYVLRYVLRYKNLKYVVEDYAILIIPIDYVLPEELETEIFRLSTSGIGISTGAMPTPGFRSSEDLGGGGFEGFGGGFEEESGGGQTENIEEWLRKAGGVTWGTGTNIVYHQPTATLIVTNTPTNMVLIRELIKIWDRPPMQVEVTARFVELQYNRNFENSFKIGMTDYLKWTRNEERNLGTLPLASRERVELLADPSSTLRVSASTPVLDIKGILTRPEFRIIWYALDQSGYSDLLSAPRVTTISGNMALIQVVQEIRYPTEYETESLEDVYVEAGAVVYPFYVTPGTFETREVGIRLNVTPTVSSDGEVITLVLLPEVSDLVGWINYGTDFIPAWQPTFESRDVTTTVYINDGETLVLGGVIQADITTVSDRVPFLGSLPLVGRLFRSEYEIADKSNLVIFVSADLITSRGTRVRQEREMTKQRERFFEQFRGEVEAAEREMTTVPEGT